VEEEPIGKSKFHEELDRMDQEEDEEREEVKRRGEEEKLM